jgi:hypothetical protein
VHDETEFHFDTLTEIVDYPDRVVGDSRLTAEEVVVVMKLVQLYGQVFKAAASLPATPQSRRGGEGLLETFSYTLAAGGWGKESVSEERRKVLDKAKTCFAVAYEICWPGGGGGEGSTEGGGGGYREGLENIFRACLSGGCTQGLSTWRSLCDGSDLLPTHIIHAVNINMPGRRMFLTKGGLLGLSPAVLQAGDVCCVVGRAVAPFVLRPVDGGADDAEGRKPVYRLVRECYVDGVMHGEAVRARDQEKLAWDDITLV